MRSVRVDLAEVAERCSCGRAAPPVAQRFGCRECGYTCCSACAVTLESVAYCRHCATALLGTARLAVGATLELW